MAAVYRCGEFEVRVDERRLLARGEPVPVGARAFDLLLVLIEQRERVVGKDELLARVWPGLVVEENNLTVQVSALRKALGVDAVATVAGRGYRFTMPVTSETAAAPGAPASPRPGTEEAGPRELPLPDKPSIAVLPFANLSGDPEQEYFSDGAHSAPASYSRANTCVQLALCYVGMGDLERARQEFDALRQAAPEYVAMRLAGQLMWPDEHVRHRLFTFLRIAAGLENPAAETLR